MSAAGSAPPQAERAGSVPLEPALLHVEQWDTRLHKYLGLEQLLLLYPVRVLVNAVRKFYFIKVRGQLKSYSPTSSHIAPSTVPHNLLGLKDLAATRTLGLIRPLSALDVVSRRSRVLSVGPRTEAELLSLVGHGFQAGRVRGLDLISYSSWVDLGDMHAMPYRNDCWDVVILSACMVYSERPQVVAAEAVRVARDGAVICVGADYDPRSDGEIQSTCGYLPGSQFRLDSVREMLALFEPHVDHVYFSQDVIPARRGMPGTVLAIFSIKKTPGPRERRNEEGRRG